DRPQGPRPLQSRRAGETAGIPSPCDGGKNSLIVWRHSAIKHLRLLALTAAVAASALPAAAQTYPGKPIKIIVSTSPGGATDILARILGHHITTKTGRSHVIDNRAGASGNIAMEAAPPPAADTAPPRPPQPRPTPLQP